MGEFYTNKRAERIGEIRLNNFNQYMKIVEYINAHNIVVEFQDKHKAKVPAQYSNFKRGTVKNPYFKEIYNVGYMGVGKHKIRDNGKVTKKYYAWTGMIRRCYNKKEWIKNPTYKDCTVCDEWHNYQNFGDWYDENYYSLNSEEKMAIDKDILVKGNKIYSPETCLIVPTSINNLFLKSNALRGEYPIGVSYNKSHNCLIARVNNPLTSREEFLGDFHDENKAFLVYKARKEEIIKQVADHYKSQIPTKLYEALYAWEVEIDD